MKSLRKVALALLALMVLTMLVNWFEDARATEDPDNTPGKTRFYYIAADEVQWDYAPSGMNKYTGESFDEEAGMYVNNGPDRIGRVYTKARYREYTDSSFKTLKPVTPEWEHLGILGPLIRAEVGDTIKVVFRNNTRIPVTMHPHGVLYKKDSEGAPYEDGTSGLDKSDDFVDPGQSHAYIWSVPERAGPGPRDPSSIVWLYHSHAREAADVYAGLVGAIIVTRRGSADPDGKPKDVDREFVNLFMVFNENASPYIDENIKKYAGNPPGVNKDDPDFQESNLKHSINGYLYANMPQMTMKQNERVRWYLIGLGNEVDTHTVHWHGNTVDHLGSNTDVVMVAPAVMTVADMVADNPGVWLYHCHVADHMMAGMIATYTVTPA